MAKAVIDLGELLKASAEGTRNIERATVRRLVEALKADGLPGSEHIELAAEKAGIENWKE